MLAWKWLFLRLCGHLTNARDRDGAKRSRGALIYPLVSFSSIKTASRDTDWQHFGNKNMSG